MMSSSGADVSVELGLGLVGPEHPIVPLMASLSYSCADQGREVPGFMKHVSTPAPTRLPISACAPIMGAVRRTGP